MRKFGRKILSALLALALLVSLLPIGAAPAQAEGLTIEIYSEKDLWEFSDALSQNTAGYANANVSLEQNIDLGNAAWVPIGTNYHPGADAITFTGTFDGNGTPSAATSTIWARGTNLLLMSAFLLVLAVAAP